MTNQCQREERGRDNCLLLHRDGNKERRGRVETFHKRLGAVMAERPKKRIGAGAAGLSILTLGWLLALRRRCLLGRVDFVCEYVQVYHGT